jgi:uncharacterized protein (DUF849 family)
MARKVMISCAVTGSADTPGKNPAVPVTPEQIANSCLDAAKAGAAIVHIHVRDPKTTRPSMDKALYREAVDRIREKNSDVLINLTTGPGARFFHDEKDPSKPSADSVLRGPAERVQHVMEIKPEICSLDMGSLNMGDRVFINTPTHLKAMALAIKDAGVTPELEVFDSGDIRLACQLLKDGDLPSPSLFQLVLGIRYGFPGTPEALLFAKSLLPENARWAAMGISAMEFPIVAQAAVLGGHVRVGLEDNLYLEKGVFAPSNAVLVERAVSLLRLLGKEPATPAEARDLLGLRNP